MPHPETLGDFSNLLASGLVGLDTSAWMPPLVPTGPWEAPCRASLNGMGGHGVGGSPKKSRVIT